MIRPIIHNRGPRKAEPRPTAAPARPINADEVLYQLAGQILTAAKATEDDRIKKLSDYVVGLVTSDPAIIQELLIRVATDAQQPAPTNPFLDAMRAKMIDKPVAAAAAPIDQNAVIAQAKELIANLEKENGTVNERPTSPADSTAGEPSATT